MKKLFLILLAASAITALQAQVKFGIKGGFSSANVEGNEFTFLENGQDTMALSVLDLKGGYHVGVLLRVQMKKFYIQPEVLFNSNRADFTLRDIGNPDGMDQILEEHYQYVDVPFMLGLKFGALRVQGGPVGHFFLDSRSDLFEIDAYDQMFDEATFGWQAGLGLDIWNIILDFKYEGNFKRFGDHIEIGDESFEVAKRPTRWIISAGIMF